MTIPAGAELFDPYKKPVAGETIVIYGMNHGDTDDQGPAMKDDGFCKQGMVPEQ